MTSPTEPDWLLTEDLALKSHLTGITVSDGSATSRPVRVYFQQPDAEIRSQSFPYMTLDLIDISENTPQVMSSYGPITSQHLLDRLPTGSDTFALTGEEHISPMLLTYQVVSWARQPRHDRAILSTLNHGPLHDRFAKLQVSPTDLRRLVVRGFAKRDTVDAEGKRLFRNIWTVQVPTEIIYDEIVLTQRAASVIINNSSIAPTPPSSVLTPISYI